MSILVLGKGLLGTHFEKVYPSIPVLSHQECDITSRFDIDAVMYRYQPEIVVNCAGIIPQSSRIQNVMDVLQVNSRAPKLLQAACDERGAKLIQVSTDCVFSGTRGHYSEIDVPAPLDLYGISKTLGEITEFPHLTIRSSFMGFPDPYSRGLLGWAARQSKITGYDSFLWNGLTSTEFVQVLVEKIIPGKYSNLLHVYGKESLSKYDILLQAREVFGWNYDIVRESDFVEEENWHVKNATLTSELPEMRIDKSFEEMLIEMRELWKK